MARLVRELNNLIVLLQSWEHHWSESQKGSTLPCVSKFLKQQERQDILAKRSFFSLHHCCTWIFWPKAFKLLNGRVESILRPQNVPEMTTCYYFLNWNLKYYVFRDLSTINQKLDDKIRRDSQIIDNIRFTISTKTKKTFLRVMKKRVVTLNTISSKWKSTSNKVKMPSRTI